MTSKILDKWLFLFKILLFKIIPQNMVLSKSELVDKYCFECGEALFVCGLFYLLLVLLKHCQMSQLRIYVYQSNKAGQNII